MALSNLLESIVQLVTIIVFVVGFGLLYLRYGEEVLVGHRTWIAVFLLFCLAFSVIFGVPNTELDAAINRIIALVSLALAPVLWFGVPICSWLWRKFEDIAV